TRTFELGGLTVDLHRRHRESTQVEVEPGEIVFGPRGDGRVPREMPALRVVPHGDRVVLDVVTAVTRLRVVVAADAGGPVSPRDRLAGLIPLCLILRRGTGGYDAHDPAQRCDTIAAADHGGSLMPIRSSLTSSVVDFGGRGRPIVLLHGLMGRATTWWRVSRWLTSYGHVVGLDARGHGRARRRGSWRTEEFADDVAELISDLDEGPAVIIGHSMGGLHAWVTAARWPELVRAVVVEDMAPDQRGKTVDAWRGYFESWPVPFRSLAQVREF